MDDKSQTQEEKREARRKRRVQNQILAYLVLILLILAVAGGIVYAVGQITAVIRQREEVQEENQAKLEELFADEGEIEVPSPTPEPPVELTFEEKLDEIVDAAIGVMPLENKVAGLFIVTPEAITGVSTAVQAGEGTKDALDKYPVGGLVYFSKNIQSEEQITEMLKNTHAYLSSLFLAVDEEGGSAARLADAGIMDPVDGAQAIGGTGDADNAHSAGVAIGAALNSVGFNLDFAPVADITSVENSVMVGRAYGSDAATAAPFVAAMVQGLKEQNITTCLKHFPGNGATSDDAHAGIAISDRTAEEFRAEEFAVFKAGIDAGADMIMMSHMAVPAFTGDNTPCSLSKEVVTDILREELGFEGVIITDALNMSAISEYNSSADAAVTAIKAGCDMLLMPEDFEEAYNAVLQAVQDGVISEERINDSLRRVYRIKYADRVAE